MRDSQGREVRQFLVGEWGPEQRINVHIKADAPTDGHALAAKVLPAIRKDIAARYPAPPPSSEHLLPIAAACFAFGWVVTAIVLRRHR